MIQLVLIVLGAVLGIMGLMVTAKGELQVSAGKRLTGGSARGIGLSVLAAGVVVVGYALFILPRR